MDRMNDEELLFVIGHEMGHVVEQHIKRKIRLAYASSAVRKAIASQQSEAGEMARSVLGALAENLVNAQFSQQEERSADDYGVRFLKQEGYGAEPAISALTKLATLGGGHSLLASHPAPESRAERLQAGPQPGAPDQPPSLLKRIIVWLQNLWPFGGDEPAGRAGEKRMDAELDEPVKRALLSSRPRPAPAGREPGSRHIGR
jgi:putative metalloprotease